MIKAAIENEPSTCSEVWGSIRVDPYEPANVGASSLDLTLDRHFLFPEVVDEYGQARLVDPFEDQTARMRPATVLDGKATLMPHQFALGATVERVHLSNRVAAKIEGKSSLGRLGLNIHITAGFVDPGFNGHLTLELVNDAPWAIALWPGMKIAQICFMPLTGNVDHPYGADMLVVDVRGERVERATSKYQHQRGPTPSRYHQNARPKVS
jgi:dCTP deaminase